MNLPTKYPIELTLDLDDWEYVISKLSRDVMKDRRILDEILMQVYD
jgi:hypothetical protein